MINNAFDVVLDFTNSPGVFNMVEVDAWHCKVVRSTGNSHYGKTLFWQSCL